MIKTHEAYLAKIQSAYGTPEDNLGADDFVEVLQDSKLDIIPSSDEYKTCAGRFSQNPAVIGSTYCDVQLDFNLRSFGADVIPDYANLWQAGNMKLTPTDVTNGIKYVLTPADESKDATVWKYGGSKKSNGSQLKKAENCQFDWKISSESGKRAVLSLIGKGTLAGIPVASSIPSGLTKSNAFVPAFLNTTKVILGSAVYRMIKWEYSANNVVEMSPDGSEYGYGPNEVTDQSIKWAITVYAESPNVIDPYTALLNSQEGQISFMYGPQGRKISITSLQSQLIDIKESSQGNIVSWDLSGLCIDNIFEAVINADLT